MASPKPKNGKTYYGAVPASLMRESARIRYISTSVILFSIGTGLIAGYIGNNAISEFLVMLSGVSVMGLSIWVLYYSNSGKLTKAIAICAVSLAVVSQTINILDEYPIIREIPILNHEDRQGNIKQVTLMLGFIFFVVALYLAVIETGFSKLRLRIERDFFTNVMKDTSTFICVVRANGTVSYANPAAVRLKGETEDAIIGRDWWECFAATPPSDPQLNGDIFFTQDVQDFHLPCIAVDGKKRHIAWSSNNRLDSDGKLLESIRLGTDITQRRAYEEERNRLATVVEQTHDLVAITDAFGIVRYVNPAFLSVTGYGQDEVLGITLYEIGGGQYSPELLLSLQETLVKGEIWRGHIRHMAQNKKELELKVTVSPIRNKETKITGFVVTYRDVSHETELENQLRQAQKMQAVGTLAGGVAHDFNNILSPIIGYTEMAMHEVPRESEAYKYLVNIMDAGLRAKELVKQILTFGRQSEQQRKPVRLAPILREAMKLVRGSLPASIEIVEQINTTCPPVLADPTQLHQVLMNLCTNAYHAMEEKGGTLCITLKTERITPSQVDKNPGLKAGDYCCLSVADTGDGIDDSVRHRIFEPYFTTKLDGKGIGLGLATVHGIIRTHDGFIQLDSQKGKGTEVRVYIPLLSAETPAEPPKEEAVIQGAGEKILLVDDEFSVLQVTRRLLNRLGYEVVACSSPLEALDIFKKDPAYFDLALTDLSMPKMNGLALAEALHDIRRDLPVILSTGFHTPELEIQAASAGIRAIAPKPLTPKELSRYVHNALHP